MDNKSKEEKVKKTGLPDSSTLTTSTAVDPQPLDTTKPFIVDDFPVPDQVLGQTLQSSMYMKSGDVHSVDKVWFTNDKLGQTLVFSLYTDYYRSSTFLFSNNDIPRKLVEWMELQTNTGLASESEKIENFEGLVRQAKKGKESYFTTNKGFRLGDAKQKVLNGYGNPDRVTKSGNVEIGEWWFTGENSYTGKEDRQGKPLAANSFGHDTTMFFRNDKLIALIFHNNVP